MVLGESPSFLANSACDKPICLANKTKSFGGMPLRIEAISVDGFAARLSGLAAAGILACLMPGYGRGVSISAVAMRQYKVHFVSRNSACQGMQFCREFFDFSESELPQRPANWQLSNNR